MNETGPSHAERMNAEILVYKATLLFLKDVCSTKFPRFQTTVDDYMLSMVSHSAVSAIVDSLACGKRLLELSSELGLANDPKFRAALRTDDKGIATLLAYIFSSGPDKDATLRLEGDSAQYFLDVVQDCLDKGFLLEHRQAARRLIRKMSEACDSLPSSLFITGVSERDENATFGGGYGDIYCASYGGKRVALKRLRHFLRGSDLRRLRLKFCREALVWRDLHHPYILPFLGIDKDSFPEPYFCMVSPWMEHGTVIKYLERHGLANVDKLLYEIAQGLQYLHARNIVHGDLRGANILINDDWSACLADFGLSGFSDSNSSTSARGGSLYWMAPELLDPDRFGHKFTRTTATDVYAFGCVCIELYTGQHPFSDLSEAAALLKVIDGERPARPSSPVMPDVLWQHVIEFWAQDPTARPATDLVVHNMVWPIPLIPPNPQRGYNLQHREDKTELTHPIGSVPFQNLAMTSSESSQPLYYPPRPAAPTDITQAKRQRISEPVIANNEPIDDKNGELKKGPKSCARCKNLKVKCEFKTETDPCKRCFNGGHDCVTPGRKKRRTPPKREHLLNQIREQAAEIQKLIAQVEQSNARQHAKPLSSAATYSFPLTPSSSSNNELPPPFLFPHSSDPASYFSSSSADSKAESENNRAVEDWIARARDSLAEFDGFIGIGGTGMPKSLLVKEEEAEIEVFDSEGEDVMQRSRGNNGNVQQQQRRHEDEIEVFDSEGEEVMQRSRGNNGNVQQQQRRHEDEIEVFDSEGEEVTQRSRGNNGNIQQQQRRPLRMGGSS
ncbi:kinase-like domain-containing protein [Mycena sanguinolenta]|nr:kinase-like domain-containing protein [Mycena sanguinolenta]